MKLILLISLFTVNAHAGNYFPVGKAGAKTTWTKQARCEAVEGQECFEITGKDLRYHVVKNVQVDDSEKPIYAAKEEVQACIDSDSCYAVIQPICTGEGGDRICQSYCLAKGLPSDYYPVVAGDFTEVYCTRISGYEKKWVGQLSEDAAKKAAAQAEDAQKLSDNSSRDTARPIREGALRQCVQDSKNPTLSPKAVKDCIAALVREVLGDKVDVGDL